MFAISVRKEQVLSHAGQKNNNFHLQIQRQIFLQITFCLMNNPTCEKKLFHNLFAE